MSGQRSQTHVDNTQGLPGLTEFDTKFDRRFFLHTQAHVRGCLPLENFDRPCFLVVVDVVVVVVVVVVVGKNNIQDGIPNTIQDGQNTIQDGENLTRLQFALLSFFREESH